jgi:hypothetical protein
MIRTHGIKVGDTVVITDYKRTMIAEVRCLKGMILLDYPGEKLVDPVILRKASDSDILQFKLTGSIQN